MSDPTAESEVAAVLEAVRQGYAARDPQAIAAQYAAGATLFDLAPPLAHGVDAGGLQAWLDTWDGPVRQELRDMRFTVGGDIAFGHGFIRVSARSHGGEDAAWWMRATVALARRDGAWTIVHEHTSVPFYMDGSFRAAIDLEP